MLQQNVLLKFKYFVKFLQQHGPEVFPDVRLAYVETLSRIYRSALSKYVISLSQLQLDVVSKQDVLGVEEALSSCTHRAGPLKGRASVFALGARSAVMRDLDGTPPLIVHQAEAAGEKHCYEVLFRSAHKLLIDSATSEFLFCQEFWAGDPRIFAEIFAPAIAAVDDNLGLFLPSCTDLVCVILMLRVNHEHQLIMARRQAPCLDAYLERVNAALWPRFKSLFEAQLASVRCASEQVLLSDVQQAHYVTRRYAELAASTYSLHATSSEGQVDQCTERLRGAVFDLISRMARLVGSRKQRMVFFIKNYDVVLSVMREAAHGRADPGCEGAEAGPVCTFFNEQLLAQVHLLVEDELADQFNPLVSFVQRAEAAYKQAEGEGGARCTLPQFGPTEAEPLLRDFRMRWQMSLEEIHRSIGASFGSSPRALDILQRTLSQLLLFYTRLTGPEGVLATHCGAPGALLCREAVPTATILTEIKRIARA